MGTYVNHGHTDEGPARKGQARADKQGEEGSIDS